MKTCTSNRYSSTPTSISVIQLEFTYISVLFKYVALILNGPTAASSQKWCYNNDQLRRHIRALLKSTRDFHVNFSSRRGKIRIMGRWIAEEELALNELKQKLKVELEDAPQFPGEIRIFLTVRIGISCQMKLQSDSCNWWCDWLLSW